MNENWNQNSDFKDQVYYQAPILKKNAADFRAEARKALKPCYWYAVLACLIASLLGAVTLGNIELGSSEKYEGDVSAELSEIYDVYAASGVSGVFDAYPIFIFVAVVVVIAAVFGILFSLFVSSPVIIGYQRYNLSVIDGDGKNIGTLFRYFKEGYAKSIGLNLVHGLINIACSLPLLAVMLGMLWINRVALFHLATGNGTAADGWVAMLTALGILAIVILTGVLRIWVACRFYFCYMILAEYPEISVWDALRNSVHLMRGNKWRLFCLQFSFIGWDILAGLTFGIGACFLEPYKQAAYAEFYNEIANRQAARDVEFPSLDPNDYITD